MKLCLLLCLASGTIFAQKSLKEVSSKAFEIGKTITVKSDILEEDRTLNIYLPEGYDTLDKKYPVIYLLDGSANEDFVHIAPNSTLCGGIRVGEGTLIGSGATIIPNISIGKWAVVGAGSVVVSDIPDYAVVVGNPGKVIKILEPV